MRARRAGAAALAFVLTVAASACSGGDGDDETLPEPSVAAERFAEAFTDGDFADVVFTDLAPAEVTEAFNTIVFGMGELRPVVEVGGMRGGPGADGDDPDDRASEDSAARQATALLDVVWTFPDGRQWSYETEAELRLVEEAVAEEDDDEDIEPEWQVVWSPAIVEPTLVAGEILTVERTRPERGQILGIDDQPFEVRRPDGDLAREVLGVAGEATAEQIEESEGRLQIGDITGRSGLERSADDVLAGSLGIVVNAVTQAGDAAPREVFRLDAVDGADIHTSLDVRLQLAARDVLADVGPPSALVAIRPSTGQVVAVASGPGSSGLSTATLGQYAPGSTFKVVSSLALLRAGLTPDTEIECPETIRVDGRDFKNYGDYPPDGIGTITLRTALANSCNTAFIGQRTAIEQADLTSAGEALGIGVVSPMGVPHFEGQIPADATEVQHAASMIGQDRILVSPLAMAAVAASVAAGETVHPTLVEPEPGDEVPTVDEPLTAEEALLLRSMMEAVVAEGSGRLLADLPGPPAGAKTGTAEYGTAVPPRTHAWMIAVHGDLAVSVFVEDGPGGSTTAGPILERFLRTVG